MKKSNELISRNMPVLALRGLVLFPHMLLHFDVGREKSLHALSKAMENDRRVFLIAQKDQMDENPDAGNLYEIGTIAEIKQIVRSQGESLRILVQGVSRAKLLDLSEEDNTLVGELQDFPASESIADSQLSDALVRTVKELFEEYINLAPRMPKEIIDSIKNEKNPCKLAELLAGHIPFDVSIKQQILEISSAKKRLEILAKNIEKEVSILVLESDIQDKVRESMDKNQRDYYLREQLKVINEELADGDLDGRLMDDIDEIKSRIDNLQADDIVKNKLRKEYSKMKKMPSNSQEASVIRDYLDVCLDIPWNIRTTDNINIQQARELLDREHFGLKKVKERIIESLAVRAMAPNIKGQILCLVGPPGVGKTSIAHSIADTMGRKYVRIALGGVIDEAEIRGHRKTYVASMPGRIIEGLINAKSCNPVMLLDEVDKLGNNFKGDPSSALLEVLDSEQNCTFRDHYVELPFDLSDVFFIATANDRSQIPAALLDRMEIIELPSYTRDEKFNIAKKHLIPKQKTRHGLRNSQLSIQDECIYQIIDQYTKEAGVRELERQIATICRKVTTELVANPEKDKITVRKNIIPEWLGPKHIEEDLVSNHDEIGLVNGLAWTSVGGELLQVEVAVVPGSGKLTLTGSLGDVMKESASAAMTYIRSVASDYKIESDFYKDKDIHVHFPEGAVPKDGPSAGITTCTAILSALTMIPVNHTVAMTGEITLRGRVLPIGGLREKSMAAYKNHIKTVIIPFANIPDLSELDDVVKNNIQFIPVKSMNDVLKIALNQVSVKKKTTKTITEKVVEKEELKNVLC